ELALPRGWTRSRHFAADRTPRPVRRMSMQLLPPEIADRLPSLYSQEGQGERAIAQVKFFTPWTCWTWYASEYDPVERIFFGVVVGLEREIGSFSLDELQAIRGPGGLT